jgi:uncharacterized protein YndB with AHSA1/START domain
MTETSKQIYRITIRAPIQDVWDTLTKDGEPLPFFFGSVLHTTGLKPGAQVRMRTPNNKYTGVVGEVLEFEPPHRYVMTFKFTDLDDPPCKVTHELREVEEGVEYLLISEQIPAGTKTEKYMAGGGKFITETLKSVLETGKPPMKSRMILLMIRLTGWMTPKRCRSEHWPLQRRVAILPGAETNE